MSSENKRFWEKLRFHLGYLWEMMVTTPYYPWIILFSLLGGFFTFFGFPLLIPVLDYLRTGGLPSSSPDILQYMEKALAVVGIQPSFYSMLAVASILILLGELLVNFTSLLALYASFDLIRNYSKRMFDAYLKVNWLWLTSTNSGELNYVILREAEMAATCHLYVQRLVILAIQCIVYFYLAIRMSVSCVIFAAVLYGGLMLLNLKNAHIIQRVTGINNEIFKKMAGLFNGIQQNKKFLKTSLLNESIVDRTVNSIESIRKNYQKIGLRLQMQQGWNFIVLFLFLVSLIVFHDRIGLDYSSLLVLILVFNRLAPQFNNLAGAYSSLNSYLPMYFSIKSRLKEMNENIEQSSTKHFDGRGDIRFEHVDFTYPNGAEVLKDVNLTIPVFRTVAIVGSSGAGKTTILDLILGLLAPNAGVIYYGDIRHDELNLNSLRSKVAYISQDPALLDGTLRENLIIGCPKATEAMIEDMCRKVHMDKFVKQLPEGLETLVGENGIKLSGGQRQRVVLARSLFMNPKILILDEATSELDSETEKMIQETIKDLSKELTIIIVAHRLSTVRLADYIYVLDEGGVCESGTYQELLERKGKFHLFDSLQRS